MASLDRSQCPAEESIPGEVGGAWGLRGTRTQVKALFENLDLRAFVARSLDNGFRLTDVYGNIVTDLIA